jgi:predicted 2-oxoglutarate/Fe(II)-dependent dioxygenase YbiX
MQKILFNKKECKTILDGINDSVGSSILNLADRKYKEWLVVDKNILDLVLSKVKIFGVEKIKEGRILKYEEGCFFNEHVDTWEKYPHRYKTIIIQLSDETDYDGGELKFGNEILSKKIGTTTIFEGTILHGMSPITNGVRYVFVIWLERNDFGIKKVLV